MVPDVTLRYASGYQCKLFKIQSSSAELFSSSNRGNSGESVQTHDPEGFRSMNLPTLYTGACPFEHLVPTSSPRTYTERISRQSTLCPGPNTKRSGKRTFHKLTENQGNVTSHCRVEA